MKGVSNLGRTSRKSCKRTVLLTGACLYQLGYIPNMEMTRLELVKFVSSFSESASQTYFALLIADASRRWPPAGR